MNSEIIKEFEQGGKRVVMFGEKRDIKHEKPSFELLPYADYIKKEAERRGLTEKMGMMVNPETRKVDRGQECEQELLGKCKIDRKEKIPVPADRTAVTLQKAKNEIFEFARNHQPHKNEQDEENISKEVEQIIKEKLNESDLPKPDTVKFYTAVSTPLDYQYGIDGWIEILEQNGNKELITFDLKTGNYKDSSIQADIMLKLDLQADGFTPKETLSELFRFTNEVIDTYRERTELEN